MSRTRLSPASPPPPGTSSAPALGPPALGTPVLRARLGLFVLKGVATLPHSAALQGCRWPQHLILAPAVAGKRVRLLGHVTKGHSLGAHTTGLCALMSGDQSPRSRCCRGGPCGGRQGRVCCRCPFSF